MRRRARRGLSLVEAVMSMFLLVFGFAIMARLFHQGLRYEASTDAQQEAALAAESMMEQVRGWNWTVHKPGSGTPFSVWSGCPGDPGVPDPNTGLFMVTTNSTLANIYNPCSTFEDLYPATERRVMTQSSRWVMVQVTWPGHAYYLESLIAAPPANTTGPYPSIATDPSSPSAMTQSSPGQTFSAMAQDSNGAQLFDVFFSFSVGGVGDGTVLPPSNWQATTPWRDPNTTTLSDQITLKDYMADPTGAIMGTASGPAYMHVTARVRGIDTTGDSNVFSL